MGFQRPSWIFNGVKESRDGPKTIHIFLGFFFIVNFCLGIGSLGIPYAFFYSGLLAAVPTLLIVSVVSWINANYLLEVMARAQVSAVCLNGMECNCWYGAFLLEWGYLVYSY